MTDPTDEEAIARTRVMVISLARLSGLVLVALGVIVLAGTLDWPRIAGYVLLAVGVVETIVIPQILVKKWRSGGE